MEGADRGAADVRGRGWGAKARMFDIRHFTTVYFLIDYLIREIAKISGATQRL